jgi:predicted CXXCH cytochrome family protein
VQHRGAEAGRRQGRPAWRSAASAAATAALMAVAIGTPVAFADAGTNPADALAAVVAAATGSSTPTPTPVAASLAPATQVVNGLAGEAIGPTTAFTPTGVGGPVTYTVSPALPDGLTMSDTTGVITGTPVLAQVATDYTVTATGLAVFDATPSPSASASATASDSASPTASGSASPAPSDSASPTASGSASPAPSDSAAALVDASASASTSLKSGPMVKAAAATPAEPPATADAVVTIAVDPTLAPASQQVLADAEAAMAPSLALQAVGFPHPIANPPTYSTSPTLPDGMVIDAVTGIISGTPTTAQEAAAYTITASDGTFKASTTADITINCPGGAGTPPSCQKATAQPAALAGPMLLSVNGIADAIHGPYSPNASDPLDSDTCSRCHRIHSAPRTPFLGASNQTSTELCQTCHASGAGAEQANIVYSATAPVNKPLAADGRMIYRHDPTAVGTHQPFYSNEDGSNSPSEEFAAANNPTLHAACVDCHNPHDATATTSAQVTTSESWSASGYIKGASGVIANNPPTGAASYALAGGSASSFQKEYQLCFKCHSGYTKIATTDSTGATYTPEQQWLDKAIEFDPTGPDASTSQHPVEAPGTGISQKLNDSLSNNSVTPSLRRFTGLTTASVIRCTDCHSDVSATKTAVQPTHVSANRGILAKPYLDRGSSSGAGGYSAAKFELCFMCHSQRPFTSTSKTNVNDTNFGLHGYHMDKGYLCSDCHFRLHSTKFPAPYTAANGTKTNQTLDGTRLVNFNPGIVSPSGGVIKWTTTAVGAGTCTLTCHGTNHSNFRYPSN